MDTKITPTTKLILSRISTNLSLRVGASITKIIAVIWVFGVVFALGLSQKESKALAHTNNSWLTVDGKALVKESPDQVPLNLQAADHLLSGNFEAGKNLSFKIFPGLLLEKDDDLLEITWDFGDSSKQESGRTVAHTYSKNGTYIINVKMSRSGSVIGEEPVYLNVGNNYLASPAIKIDGKNVQGTELQIKRDQMYKFVVGELVEGVKYTWDLGEDKTKSATEVELNFRSAKLPNYIFLRAEKDGFYKDSWVRVNSDEPPAVEILRPADTEVNPTLTPAQAGLAADTSDPFIALMLLLTALVGVITAASALVIFRRRQSEANKVVKSTK